MHGDLAGEHVLYDAGARGQVTGIIDWSEMALSDPGIDLAAFYYWGARALALCPGGRDEWAPK